MFQFPACPLPRLYIQRGVPGHDSRWVAPFGDPRIKRLLAATRGLSQHCYVLHRPLVPRHPPCALSSLTFLSSLVDDGGNRRSAMRATAKTRDVCFSTLKICCSHGLVPGNRKGIAGAAMRSRRRILNDKVRGRARESRRRTRRMKWRRPGSNRRPPACKAGALPAELRPRRVPVAPRQSGRSSHHRRAEPGVVGLSGFEPETSRLSAVRSHQLS